MPYFVPRILGMLTRLKICHSNFQNPEGEDPPDHPAEDVTGASEILKARILLLTQLKMLQELQKSLRQGSSCEAVNWDFESSFSGFLSGKEKVPHVRVYLPHLHGKDLGFRLLRIFSPSTSPTWLVTGASNPEEGSKARPFSYT